MDLQVELNALKSWEAETELREREVELMERLIDQPNNRAVQMELDEVRRKLHALGCDTEPLLNPTIPAEQSPVVAWTRKAPVHPSKIGEPEPEPEPWRAPKPAQRPSVLRTSTAAGLSAPPPFAAPTRGPLPTTSRQETLGMVANYFATQLDSQDVDLGAGKVVKGFDTTGDGVVDSLDMSGDGNLDAKILAAGETRARVSVDGSRARQQSMAVRAVSLAERATSRPDGGSILAESPRHAEQLAARRDKLKQLRERRCACCPHSSVCPSKCASTNTQKTQLVDVLRTASEMRRQQDGA